MMYLSKGPSPVINRDMDSTNVHNACVIPMSTLPLGNALGNWSTECRGDVFTTMRSQCQHRTLSEYRSIQKLRVIPNIAWPGGSYTHVSPAYALQPILIALSVRVVLLSDIDPDDIYEGWVLMEISRCRNNSPIVLRFGLQILRRRKDIREIDYPGKCHHQRKSTSSPSILTTRNPEWYEDFSQTS